MSDNFERIRSLSEYCSDYYHVYDMVCSENFCAVYVQLYCNCDTCIDILNKLYCNFCSIDLPPQFPGLLSLKFWLRALC